jgi:hypothetical protein
VLQVPTWIMMLNGWLNLRDLGTTTLNLPLGYRGYILLIVVSIMDTFFFLCMYMCLWWRAVRLMSAILSLELIVIVIIRIVLNLMMHHRHGFLDSVRDRCLPLVSGFAIKYRLI